jgi:hypothetical protein
MGRRLESFSAEVKFGLSEQRNSFFPSPLVGEGGSNERSEFERGEGLSARIETPHPARSGAQVRSKPRHLLPQGEKEEKSPGREAGARIYPLMPKRQSRWPSSCSSSVNRLMKFK